MKIIAKIYTEFDEKFGIPRQSGLVKETVGKIVFEPEYRNPEALRGIEGYSHLWLLWQFSEAVREDWSPTVRPPRLGGNKRMGVFATRSPYRPNSIGLSSVRLLEVKETKNEGTVLIVGGADILSGTPIYDVKPYLAYTDSHPDAIGGFADEVLGYEIEVELSEEVREVLTDEEAKKLVAILREDPRPSYKSEDEKIYGMKFSGKEIKFKHENCKLLVTNIE
ncbi:MAG: tRNA (N6-threonylcarbamoyladenosine(37)-N6)-methyltransferase TrmO [Clostridia bacterium]|nr:tRNA (N6-threonylcarbamoyladenosine(37)-N6)-methyltransferase TrmO [Clostridia bacterium]